MISPPLLKRDALTALETMMQGISKSHTIRGYVAASDDPRTFGDPIYHAYEFKERSASTRINFMRY